MKKKILLSPLIIIIFIIVFGVGIAGAAIYLGSSGDANTQGINLQKGLVGHWKLDGNAKDSTPYANNGTVTGATLTTDRKGQLNKAYSFDGDGDYVSASDATLLSRSWSAGGWFYRDYDLPGERGWMQRGMDWRWFTSVTSGSTVLRYKGDDDAYANFSPAYAPPKGQWTHQVFTYDNDKIRFYANGALITTSGSVTVKDSATSINIGYLSVNYFQGSIDDVRIYNRALSATEVTALYQEYDPGIVVSDLQKGLVGNWKMNGNAKDATSYENNGVGGMVNGGDCDSLTGWTVDNGAGGGSTAISSGTILQTEGGSSVDMTTYQTLNLVQGATYSYSFVGVAENVDGANEAGFWIGSSAGDSSILAVNWGVTGANTYSGTFTAGATNILSLMNRGAANRIVQWNTITITGPPPSVAFAADRKEQLNKAYSFDGDQDYVDAGNGASLNPGTGDFTYEFWAKSSQTSWVNILGKANGDYSSLSAGWIITIRSDIGGTPVYYTHTNFDNKVSWEIGQFFQDGLWHHWVLVGNRAAGTVELFKDGVSQGVKSPGGSFTTANITTASNLTIGCSTNCALQGRDYSGYIDDVRVYNRVLNQTEITALYQEYDPGIQVSDLQKGLMGQWKFDGNAKDSTPYSNHGTVTGAALTTDRKGQLNKAYSFDGDGDYVNAGSGASLDLSGIDFTMTMWIKFATIGAHQGIFGQKDGGANSHYVYWHRVDEKIYWRAMDSVGTIVVAYIKDWSPSVDTWYFLTFRHSGNNWEITVNTNSLGVVVDADDIDPGTDYTELGAGAGSYTNGSIDDVRIYNRALTATEITALYQSY